MPRDLRDIYSKLICTRHQLGHIAIGKIESYLKEPGPEAWDKIHRFALVRTPEYINLWMAVCHIDPNFTRLGRITDDFGLIWLEWQTIPSPETLIKALFWAADQIDDDSR